MVTVSISFKHHQMEIGRKTISETYIKFTRRIDDSDIILLVKN